MNKNLIVVLAGGFVMALLVALIVQFSFSDNEAPVDTSTTEILVASRNIPLGNVLTAKDMNWQAWPKTAVFEGVIVREGDASASEALEGRVARDVTAGEPLTNNVLLSSDGNIISSSLEPGMRAIAISVSARSMVGGFINPGDRVDVLLTHQLRVSGEERDLVSDTVNRYITETILENVRVLAVDQRAVKADDSKAQVGRTITVEVTSENAEKLALATEMGDLSLILRGVGDESVQGPGRLTTDVRTSEILKEISRREGNFGSSENRTIRVYTGDGVETIKVKGR
ncbi:MAG: Flp pilus assembly protein CpaB [Micavibrio sp.]|nr:Flp pilus assembly protein CpaB [Micavibrio sp.]